MDAEFPLDRAQVGEEIRELIAERGLEALTSKVIRKHLEQLHNSISLKEHREQIDKITREQIEEVNNKREGEKKEEGNAEEGDCVSDSDSENEYGEAGPSTEKREEVSHASKPTGQKRQAVGRVEQSESEESGEEDMVSSIKRRRSGRVQQKKPEKKTKRANKKPNNVLQGRSAYSRICVLSEDLSNLLNTRYSTRAAVVKAMWNYFRENELFDPKDRRMIVLNDPLKRIFRGKRIKPFGMMKILKRHIKDAEFLDEATRRQAEKDVERQLAASASEGKEGEEKAESSESGSENGETDNANVKGNVSTSSDDDDD